MDAAQFDTLTTQFTTYLTRRRSLGLLGLLGVVGAGRTEGVAAKKKRKKGKKGRKKGGAGDCTSPSSPCQTAAECCNARGATASQLEVCAFQPVVNPGDPAGVKCCYPLGTTAPDLINSNCCSGGVEDVPNAPGIDRCCIRTGDPDQGTPALCCDSGASTGGICA